MQRMQVREFRCGYDDEAAILSIKNAESQALTVMLPCRFGSPGLILISTSDPGRAHNSKAAPVTCHRMSPPRVLTLLPGVPCPRSNLRQTQFFGLNYLANCNSGASCGKLSLRVFDAQIGKNVPGAWPYCRSFSSCLPFYQLLTIGVTKRHDL
jgi:hypothetical protein